MVPPETEEHTSALPPPTVAEPEMAMQPTPDAGAPSQEKGALETVTSPSAPSAQPVTKTQVRVTSNYPALFRINGELVRRSPAVQVVHEVAPGRVEVKMSVMDSGYRFNKSQVVQVEALKIQDVTFTIQKVEVIIRGRPDDLRVKAMDERPVEQGVQRVTTYEGRHTLKLFHPPTGKLYEAECEVKVGQKLCTFDVKVE
jgi:hypothetical protein